MILINLSSSSLSLSLSLVVNVDYHTHSMVAVRVLVVLLARNVGMLGKVVDKAIAELKKHVQNAPAKSAGHLAVALDEGKISGGTDNQVLLWP